MPHMQKTHATMRSLSRLTAVIYHVQGGRLLGHRFLLVRHRGRRSGLLREAVLEVVRYDRSHRESVVVSALGEGADWFRNITREPALEIWTGSERFAPEQRILGSGEAAEVLREYKRNHRLVSRMLEKWPGFEFPGPGSDAKTPPMVAFRPRAR